MARKTNRRRAKKPRNRVGKVCVSFMVTALVLILSVQMGHLYHRNEEYKAQEAMLEAELEIEKQREADLKEKEAYIGSQEYYEDVAQSKLGMTYENDIVFKEEK